MFSVILNEVKDPRKIMFVPFAAGFFAAAAQNDIDCITFPNQAKS